MTDASPEAGSDQNRISIPVGGYRLEVGPTPGMAISGTDQAPAEAAAEGRKLARAAAKSDKDPNRDRDAVGEIELGAGRADEVTTQVERADHLWDGIAAGGLSITAVNDEVDTLLALLQRLDRDGRFEEQLRLARALSKLLAVAMRWLDLFRSLRALLAAAERHGHDEARAWALHQLGTLHLAAGNLVRADHDLTQAHELRRRLGDDRGRAATERNLQVLCRTLREMMRSRRLVERRGFRRFIPASNAILAAIAVIALGGATAAAAGGGLIGGGSGSGPTGPTGTTPTTTTPTTTTTTNSTTTTNATSASHTTTGSHRPPPTTAPTVSKLDPSSVALGAHTTVTITGIGLQAATAVHFGSTRATQVAPISNTQLQVVSPPGTAIGPVNVTVTAPGGTSPISAGDQFTYTSPLPAPTISEIKPASSELPGGQRLTIFGSNLSTVTTVNFGHASTTSITSNAAGDELSVVTPPKAAEDPCSVDVTVTTAAGQHATALQQLSYCTSSSTPSTTSGSSSSTTTSTTSSTSTASLS